MCSVPGFGFSVCPQLSVFLSLISCLLMSTDHRLGIRVFILWRQLHVLPVWHLFFLTHSCVLLCGTPEWSWSRHWSKLPVPEPGVRLSVFAMASLIVRRCVMWLVVTAQGQIQSREDSQDCASEPWGRYSASGGLFKVHGVQYIYSFGGDTRSHQDERGGVVSTNWRFRLGGNGTNCWERLADNPAAVGYRSTATVLNGTHVYLFGGGDTSFAATGHFWRYSLLDNLWEQLLPSQVSGPWPSARYKHATVKLSETKMLLLGGRTGTTVLSDAWCFDLEAMAWSLAGDNILQVYRHLIHQISSGFCAFLLQVAKRTER